MTEFDEVRRRMLVALLAAGTFALPDKGHAALFGRVPKPLPAGRSLYSLRGRVLVNGLRATPSTRVEPDAVIETEDGGEAVFAVGRDAFLVRSGTRLALSPAQDDARSAHTLRIGRGAVLSVFGKRQHRIELPLAQIAIRGTGIYVQAEEGRDYVCTCYGETEISARSDASSRRSVSTNHHESPLYVTADGDSGERVQDAPFRDHTDEELLILEALVGRRPPFMVTTGGYDRPRRDTY